MYSALGLSKYIVGKCIKDKKPISNLQLQKILYYIQKDYLVKDKCAFTDDIQAWTFGPVIPNVYYNYCGFGSMPITNQLIPHDIPSSDKTIIDRIVEEKRKLDPWDLVSETHTKGGAWDRVYKNGYGNHKPISISLIKRFG